MHRLLHSWSQQYRRKLLPLPFDPHFDLQRKQWLLAHHQFIFQRQTVGCYLDTRFDHSIHAFRWILRRFLIHSGFPKGVRVPFDLQVWLLGSHEKSIQRKQRLV